VFGPGRYLSIYLLIVRVGWSLQRPRLAFPRAGIALVVDGVRLCARLEVHVGVDSDLKAWLHLDVDELIHWLLHWLPRLSPQPRGRLVEVVRSLHPRPW
jgi:hypothetical protein